MYAAHVEHRLAVAIVRGGKQAACGSIEGRNRSVLVPAVALRVSWCSWRVAKRAVREVTGRTIAAAVLWRRSHTGYTSQGLRSECINWLCSSKASFVDYPEPAVLLPWEVAQKVIFWVDVVAKSASAEEGVDIAAIGKLTKNLTQLI